jgi:hypothetical protein
MTAAILYQPHGAVSLRCSAANRVPWNGDSYRLILLKTLFGEFFNRIGQMRMLAFQVRRHLFSDPHMVIP